MRSSAHQPCQFRLKWLGCACFEMDFGGFTVVSDPWITPNQQTELTWEAVEKCDAIVLTHSHYDHTLDIPALVQKFRPSVFCGENTAVPLMKWADMNPMAVYPMQPGLELDLDNVKIKALFGRHVALPGTVNERIPASKANPINAAHPLLPELGFWGDFEYRNFLFTLPDGTKILLWGNQVSLPVLRNIVRSEKPDIFLIQITTSDAPEAAAALCSELGCKIAIPVHMDFPKDYRHFARELGEKLAAVAPDTRYIIPEYGRWITL